MITITNSISIDEKEISEEFVRSSGPGGQNVNKVSTAVQLRINVLKSESIPLAVKNRLIRISGKRINSQGELIITSSEFRNQHQNRGEAYRKLFDLVKQASIVPKHRKKTRPSGASRRKRIENKKSTSSVKINRKKISTVEEGE